MAVWIQRLQSTKGAGFETLCVILYAHFHVDGVSSSTCSNSHDIVNFIGTACSYTGGLAPVCTWVCRRVCNPVCRWVWDWVADRIGREITLEDHDHLTPDEIEYIEHTENLCSNCICSIGEDITIILWWFKYNHALPDIDGPPPEEIEVQPKELESENSATKLNSLFTAIILCLFVVAFL